MYIAEIQIKNYRCFHATTIEFQPGLNVIIGENNAGKTALLNALGFIFNRSKHSRPGIHDFCQGITDYSIPPDIAISVMLRSSDRDTLDDKAVVATWLTKLKSPWEARLTYSFSLPEEHREEFKKALGESPSREKFLDVTRTLLPKYVTRIYGGEKTNLLPAEADSLDKFDFHFLTAIRDVESDMFSGSNPLLRSMLNQVLDWDVVDKPDEQAKRKSQFRNASTQLHDQLMKRLSLDQLFKLIEDTGAKDGGAPDLSGNTDEDDLIAALQLILKRSDLSIPATHNGLGYNNLVYISLLLASLDFKTDQKRHAQNAVLFPMLAIEEPEAHLHPALQYKLLKYIQRRLEEPRGAGGPIRSRQVFLTTHSTHITAAAGLKPIICLWMSSENRVSVAYPGRVFEDDGEGSRSRKHVERFLDATKSNMLFAKGVILVEGMAESLLIPCLAEYLNLPLEQHHVAVVAVDGVNFKHFVPIFGGCAAELRKFAMPRPVACLIDDDPTRKQKGVANARYKACWPFQLGVDGGSFDYRCRSPSVTTLESKCTGVSNLKVYCATKTFEYDFAIDNWECDVLVTPGLAYEEELRRLAKNPNDCDDKLLRLVEEDGAKEALDRLVNENRQKAFYATCYLLSIHSKGEIAFDLMHQLRENLMANPDKRPGLNVPKHIHKAVAWACRQTTPGG